MDIYLKQLLLEGENECLDYKQSISSASKIAKSICSFLNHKGGTLLIGVRDNKSIAGVESEDEKYMLELAASSYIKPAIKLNIIEHIVQYKTVLECLVPEGEKKPYYAREDSGKWWVYIRVNDQSLQASKIMVDVLKRQNRKTGSLISYGKNEKTLLNYLEKNEQITLNEYRKLVNISRWRAARILVNLISTGLIKNHHSEKTEYYTLT